MAGVIDHSLPAGSLVLMLVVIILLATGQIIQRNYRQQLQAQKSQLTNSFNARLESQWAPYLDLQGPFQQSDHALNILEHRAVETRLAYQVAKSLDEFTLAFTTQADTGEQNLEWFFCHSSPSSKRNYLDGYQLRLRRNEDQWHIGLCRSNHSLTDINKLVEKKLPYRDGQRWLLRHGEQLTTVHLDDQEVLRFHDLLPIEGPQQQQLNLAFDPNNHKISDIIIERAQLPELISSLTKAEMLRRANCPGNQLHSMMLLSRIILNIQTSKRHTWGAAMATAMMKEYSEALEQFDDIIANSSGEIQLAALFHAWQASVSGKKPDLALRYFKSMNARSSFDRDSQIGAVPAYVLREIPGVYLKRAQSIEKEFPHEALPLYEQVLMASARSINSEKKPMQNMGFCAVTDYSMTPPVN